LADVWSWDALCITAFVVFVNAANYHVINAGVILLREVYEIGISLIINQLKDDKRNCKTLILSPIAQYCSLHLENVDIKVFDISE
jgi:hypothetical protein